jgi:transposase
MMAMASGESFWIELSNLHRKLPSSRGGLSGKLARCEPAPTFDPYRRPSVTPASGFRGGNNISRHRLGRRWKPIRGQMARLSTLYRLGYHGRATTHGFRGVASTILNERNLFNRDWIERQLDVASVVKWSQRSRATGSAAAKPMGGRRPYLLESERDWLLARLAAKPDLTLHALLAELGERGVVVSCDTLWRFLKRQGISFKKNRVRDRTGSS